MPKRRSVERFERNAETIRSLVDAGSSRIIRDNVAGSAISGARRRYPLPRIGFRSGKITVTGYLAGERRGTTGILVKCDCGRPEYLVDTNAFKNFRSTRCDHCARLSAARKRYWIYADALPDDTHRTRLLNRLAAQISRCHVPTCRTFKHYGGRGISVCPQWRADKPAFLRYVQTLPGWDDPSLEIDRVDVNGNYEPGNIRFCARITNLHNKRKVSDLEDEIARLRHIISGTTPQVHDPDK